MYYLKLNFFSILVATFIKNKNNEKNTPITLHFVTGIEPNTS